MDTKRRQRGLPGRPNRSWSATDGPSTPIPAGHDELKGLHANTHIPKVIGAARRYEVTGETRYRDIAEFFWRQITTQRAYCTGGTSNGEGWEAEPGKLAAQLSGYTQECCVTYNMQKLTRHLFAWQPDALKHDSCGPAFGAAVRWKKYGTVAVVGTRFAGNATCSTVSRM